MNRSNGTQVFATPSFGSPGALDSTATSVVIPANTFVPGQNYTATLAFGNVISIDIFSYFTVPGVTALIKTTRFPIKAPGTTPAIVMSKGAAAGTYDFTWNSDVGRVYDFTQSADLVSWTRVALVTATGTTTTRSVTPGAAVTSRFYRLQTPP